MKHFAVALAAVLVLSVAAPAAAQEDTVVDGPPLDRTSQDAPTEETTDSEETPSTETVETVPEVDIAPLSTKAYTSDLRGYSNGRLPDGLLTEVPAGANERCLLEGDAATAWELLVLVAEESGVTGFAAGWCYRSLSQQQRTWARNCKLVQPPAPKPKGKKKNQQQAEELPPPPPPRLVCNSPTAKPGTSNHGWGRAVDIVDTTGSKPSVLSCRDPQFLWLQEHASEFGWVLPSWARCGSRTQEPWHFEWAGLNVPISQLIISVREARGVELPQ